MIDINKTDQIVENAIDTVIVRVTAITTENDVIGVVNTAKIEMTT